MPKRSRKQYLSLRRRYEPDNIKLVIVAESPPASGLYFYDPAGRTTEPLFSAIMRQLGCTPTTKADGLREMQRQGWVLVDATYNPVDKLHGADRGAMIAKDYPLLRDDLKGLLTDCTVPLILVKANVCRLLESRLVRDGFNVLNRGREIYFPSSGRQTQFEQQFFTIKEAPRMRQHLR